MRRFVTRLERTVLMFATAATLGLGTPQGASAQTSEGVGPVFVEQKGFDVFRRKVRLGKPIRVAFLGGSITAGATTRPLVDPDNLYDFSGFDRECDSWRAQVFAALRSSFEAYPEQLEMINAALSSTGSMMGAFRYALDVAAHNPDLLIIEFSINDAALAELSSSPTADGSIQRSLLSIIEQARDNNPNIALLIAISPAQNILDNPTSANAVSRAITMNAAISFGVPFVDVSKSFYEDPLPTGIERDHLYMGNPVINGNALHPSPTGHDIYASAVLDTLSRLFRFSGCWMPKPRMRLSNDLIPFPKSPLMIGPSEISLQPGFRSGTNIENWNQHPIFTGKDALFMVQPNTSVEISFDGSAVGLWWQWGYNGLPIHGKFELFLDGQNLGVFSSHPNPALGEQRLPRFQAIGEGLDPSVPHVLQIHVARDQPKLMPGVLNLAMIGLCVDEG